MTTHDMNAKVSHDFSGGRATVSINVDMSTTFEQAIEYAGPKEWLLSFKEGWDRILEETASTLGEMTDITKIDVAAMEDRLTEILNGLADLCGCPDCSNARVEQAGWENYLDDKEHPETDVEIPEWLKDLTDDA
jgi:hypothetical protein